SLRSTKQVWLVVVEQWPCCRMKNAPLQNAPCALGGSAVATITIAAKADERSAGPGERTDAPLPEGGCQAAFFPSAGRRSIAESPLSLRSGWHQYPEHGTCASRALPAAASGIAGASARLLPQPRRPEVHEARPARRERAQIDGQQVHLRRRAARCRVDVLARLVRAAVGDDAGLVHLRCRLGGGDGRVQVADLIDQARLEGLRGVEDAVVGQLGEAAHVELRAALAPDAHEARVEVVE